MAQDTNLGAKPATRHLPECNLETRTMTKAFKNSLISRSLLNHGCCVCTHTGSCSLGLISIWPRTGATQPTFPGFLEYSLVVLETSGPTVETNYICVRFDLFLLKFPSTTTKKIHSTSTQCCYFISRWGTQREKMGQCGLGNF